MSRRLLVLIAGWLGGLLLGLLHMQIQWLFLIIGLICLGLVVMRIKPSYMVAVAALLFLGYVWGGQALPTTVVHSDCLRTPIEAKVNRAISRKDNTLNYLIQTDTGCRYLLAATADRVYVQ